jgi:hypothetical protein
MVPGVIENGDARRSRKGSLLGQMTSRLAHIPSPDKGSFGCAIAFERIWVYQCGYTGFLDPCLGEGAMSYDSGTDDGPHVKSAVDDVPTADFTTGSHPGAGSRPGGALRA